jgi:hypothetical protein
MLAFEFCPFGDAAAALPAVSLAGIDSAPACDWFWEVCPGAAVFIVSIPLDAVRADSGDVNLASLAAVELLAALVG